MSDKTTRTAHALPAGAANVPHLDQYFGAWAMEPLAFQILSEQLLTMDLASHLAQHGGPFERPDGNDYYYARVEDGVGILPLNGSLMKHQTSFSRLYGGTSTALARRDLRKMREDPQVNAILLHIESPGGTSRGTAELFDDLYATRKVKKVWAYAEDCCCSAAQWIAAGADRIIANASATVASIGTYGAVADTSKAADRRGVIVHVIRAGEYKGAGQPGTEITEEQLAEFQRMINAVNDFFIQGLAKGRSMSEPKVRELADGRCHIAKDAIRLGLIDAIDSFENVLENLKSQSTRRPARSAARSNGTIRTAAGSLDPKATAEKSYGEMNDAEKRIYIESFKASQRPSPAVTRQPTTTKPVKTATQRWEEAVARELQSGTDELEAKRNANRNNPGLREAMLAESQQRTAGQR